MVNPMKSHKSNFQYPIIPGLESFMGKPTQPPSRISLDSTDFKQPPTNPTFQPIKKRSHAYAWVTWLAELLAHEKHCKYAVSFRSQYQLKTPPSTYDPSEHDRLLIDRANQLKAEGLTVYLEYENSFTVHGQTFDICVAGRPDIVAEKNGWFVVEDIKTGRQKLSHEMQVLLYMLLLPLAPETKHRFQGQIPHGRLIYPDKILEVPQIKINPTFKQGLRQVIGQISPPKLAQPTPSHWECRYCKVPHSYCPVSMMGSDNFVA